MKPLVYRAPSDDLGNWLPWLDALKNLSGAYVIRNRETGAVLYVAESHTGRLAKAIKNHFYEWNERKTFWSQTFLKHFTYQRGRADIAVRLTPPGPAAIGAQNNLINRLNPRENIQGYEPGPF